MYQIQLLNSDGTVLMIYDQSQMNERSVSAPSCTLNVNEAGTLEFTLTKDHPLINTLEPLASFVRALDDGEEIFYGRVIKRSDPTLTGMVTFSCEGTLTFLLDSEAPPDGKDSHGNQRTRHLTAEDFFRWCISTHNAETDDPRRHFDIGIINADQRLKENDYSISSYTQIKTLLENQILDIHGGFIRFRPREGSFAHWIDWIENYETLNPQPVQIGNNVEEQINETDGSNLFTVLRPVGKDGITLNPPTIDLYPQKEMEKYGRIVKTIEFRSATTVSQLEDQADDYINRIEKSLFINSSIQLVDLHYLDGTQPKIRLGDRFNNIHGLEGTEVMVSSLELHFEAPQNDTMGLKNRKSLDPDLTPEGNSRYKGKSYTKKNSKQQQAQYFKYLKEYDETLEVLAPQVYMHGQTLTQHYERIEQQAGYYESLSSRADTADQVIASHTEKINNVEQTIRDVVGSARLQDNRTLTDIVGKFEIWEDQNGHVTVHLKDGAAMTLDDENGNTITVGTRLTEAYDSINGLNQFVSSFQGSSLWTQRDNITGIVGNFTQVDTVVPDPDHPGQYKTVKKLVVESGGGFQVREDGVEYGLYMTPSSTYNETPVPAGANPQARGLYEKRSNGTYALTTDTTVQSGKKYYKRGGNAVLTAGMIVDKINDETVTKIRGDRVDVTAQHVKINAEKSLETIVGHFEEEEYLMEDGSHHPIIDPETGEQMVGKRLVYKADGGMRVRRMRDDGVITEYGVYDDGNLTGGVMVNKINGQSTTSILGNKILVGNISGNDLNTWAADKEGLIAARATINQLETLEAKVDSLDAENVKSHNLKIDIGGIDILSVRSLIVENYIDSTGYIYGSDFIIGHNNSSSGATNKYVSNAIRDLKITPSGDTYTLSYQTFKNDTWHNVSQTFSRATLLSGVWSGNEPKTLEVTATPQNEHFYQYFVTGSKQNQDGTAYSSGNKWYVPIRAYGQGNPPVYTQIMRVECDATNNYNDGYTKGSPKSATLGSLVTGTLYNLNITRNDNTPAAGLTIDCTNAFNEARKGYYTAQQYRDNHTDGYTKGSPKSATLGSLVTGTIYNLNVVRNDNTTAPGLTINCENAYLQARKGYFSTSEYNNAVSRARSEGYNTGYGKATPVSAVLGQRITGNQYYLYMIQADDTSVTTSINCGSAVEYGESLTPVATIDYTGWSDSSGDINYSYYQAAGSQWKCTNRTISMKTSQGDTREEWIGLNYSDWSDGSCAIYVKRGGWAGTTMLYRIVDLPGSASWSFTMLGTANKVTINCTIGGKTYSRTVTATNGQITG